MRNGYDLPQSQLVAQTDAALIEKANIPRSTFHNTWGRLMAFDAGYLVPFLVEEILPGDHMKYNVEAYVRLSTPLFPTFSNQRVDTFFFFVPTRILWANWVKFMGQQDNPSDSIAYTVPQLTTTGGNAVGSIFDHMGLPFVVGNIDPTSSWSVNALPFRAYNRIYNSWFRDENLINSQAQEQGNGPDSASWYTLKRRAKGHDYFTSALPWPQKFTAPSVPLAGTAPITGIGMVGGSVPGTASPVNVYETSGGIATYAQGVKAWNGGTAPADQLWVAQQTYDGGIHYVPNVYADLASATGVAINTFRQAFMVQTLLERDARGGTRYTEIIRSQFGVINPDFRLQRPEYIGGGQSRLNITPIAQTAPTTGVPVGALGAAGTSAGTHRASYAATEHGYILGLINVRTELFYQQGLNKMWSRLTRYDFYTPALAQLGEQAILNQEIYAKGSFAGNQDTNVFGYQERWQEYRTRTSEVTGIFRSNVAGTLDAWHLAQNFTGVPTLAQTFIEDTPPMTRILAAGALATNQQYLADINIHRVATRPIPTYGTPAILGRF